MAKVDPEEISMPLQESKTTAVAESTDELKDIIECWGNLAVSEIMRLPQLFFHFLVMQTQLIQEICYLFIFCLRKI